MTDMKLVDIQLNNETGQKEGTFTISNEAVIFLYEAVRTYAKGDTDDLKRIAMQKEIVDELDRTKKEMRPS